MHKVSHCLGNHPIQIQSSKIVGHFLRQRVSKSVCFIGHMGPKTEGGREAERGVQARFTSLPTCTLSELHPARLAAAAAALLFLPLPLRTGCGHSASGITAQWLGLSAWAICPCFALPISGCGAGQAPHPLVPCPLVQVDLIREVKFSSSVLRLPVSRASRGVRSTFHDFSKSQTLSYVKCMVMCYGCRVPDNFIYFRGSCKCCLLNTAKTFCKMKAGKVST